MQSPWSTWSEGVGRVSLGILISPRQARLYRYHGWQCVAESNCTNSNGGDCAMEAIQLWRSGNGGWDWEPAGAGGAGPPNNLAVVSPYRYAESMAAWNHSEMGFGDPGKAHV